MAGSETTKKLSQGELWLSLNEQTRLMFLEALCQGLNQGLRHCATELGFALTTRIADNLSAQNKLVIDSITQQARTWSKAGICVFKYSRPMSDYARSLTEFYSAYPKYGHLEPAYLLIYMDDQHGMSPEDIFKLHEHSLHGFKL